MIYKLLFACFFTCVVCALFYRRFKAWLEKMEHKRVVSNFYWKLEHSKMPKTGQKYFNGDSDEVLRYLEETKPIPFEPSRLKTYLEVVTSLLYLAKDGKSVERYGSLWHKLHHQIQSSQS